MPAPSSSPIPPAAQRPAALAPDQCRSLLEHLAQLADPRQRRGRRHALGTVLAVAACAVLAGATSLAAIAEWAADAPGPVLAALGVRRHPLTGAWRPPAEATVRRVLARVDPRHPGPGRRRMAGPPAATGTDHPAAAGTPLAASGGRGRRQDPARQRPAPQVAGASARRDGPHQPRSWPRPRWTARPTRSPDSVRCWTAWTSPTPWSPPTRYDDIGITRLMPRLLLCRGGGWWALVCG